MFFNGFTQTKPMGETMKKTLLLLTFLAVAGMSSTSAQAATHYVSGFGGVSWMNNMDATEVYQSAIAGEDYSTQTDLGSGLALTGAIGCDYGSYRLEAEVGYQTNDLKSRVDFYGGVADTYPSTVNGTPASRYEMRGDVSALTLMGNGYYDFDLGSKVELYATAGVGIAQVSFHDVNNVTNVTSSDGYVFTANPDPGLNAHETTLAWQVGAGIAAPIADNVKLDLRYRYFATTDFTIEATNTHPYNSSDTPFPVNTNLSSHSVLLGLRVDF
jgi:opacity protein-like surface antigen